MKRLHRPLSRWQYFIIGMGRAIDMGRVLTTLEEENSKRPKIPYSSQKTDAEALNGDWQAVGSYLSESMKKVRVDG